MVITRASTSLNATLTMRMSYEDGLNFGCNATNGVYICMYMFVCIYFCISVCTCMRAVMYLCACVYAVMYVYVCMYFCISVHMYVCMYIAEHRYSAISECHFDQFLYPGGVFTGTASACHRQTLQRHASVAGHGWAICSRRWRDLGLSQGTLHNLRIPWQPAELPSCSLAIGTIQTVATHRETVLAVCLCIY